MLFELRNLKELASFVKEMKRGGRTIGFIPTMGFLHEGHMSLIRMSKKEADVTITSIYVNPSQFNEGSDFDSYPRDEVSDLKLLRENCCDAVFIPNKDEVETIKKVCVDLEGLGNVMEGKFRPGHFEGVVEIVYRLFSAVTPDYAFFGEKDFQQIMVVQKMVDVLNLPVKIISAPIIRESNGLAMSSRNAKLSAIGRKEAGFIYEALKSYFGKNHSVIEQRLAAFGFELEYLEEYEFGGCKRLFIAGFFEGVRLIDNISLS